MLLLETVATAAFTGGPRSFTLSALPALPVLGTLANLLYCAAYVPDVFVQLSHFRTPWLTYRPLLWWLGMGLSALVAGPMAYLVAGGQLL